MSAQNRRTLLARVTAFLGAAFAGKAALAADTPAAKPPAGGGLAPAPSMLHVGINVSDMERSSRFYESIGFQRLRDITPDAQTPRIMGLPGAVVRARMFQLGPYQMIMRQFAEPKYSGETSFPAMHRPALLNFCVRVDNIDRVAALVKQHGGRTFDETRTVEGTKERPGPEVLFVADPDGIRVELVRIG